MKRSVEVIVNCTARALRDASALREMIVATASRAGARVHETHSLLELDHAAREIATRGADVVVLAGGDGSHMAGLSALVRELGTDLPLVALAPGGTVGTVARNFGMGGAPLGWARRVLQMAIEGEGRCATSATLRVQDASGAERVGFLFGAGLVGRFFEAYYARPKQGRAAAAAVAARLAGEALVGSELSRRALGAAPCTLAVDGETQEARAWSLVLASVVRDVGLHFLATYRAGERTDRFHLVASGLPPRSLAIQIPRVLAGRPLRGEPRVDRLARSARIAFDDPSSAYVLDGDLVPAAWVRVDVGPVIRIIVP